MRVSTSSVLLAAIASSTSLSSFVTAAPAQGTDNSMSTASEAPPPPSAPDLSSVLDGLPTSSTRRDTTYSQSLDNRGLLDGLAALLPIVDKVLTILGLKRESASAAGIESVDEQLTAEQVDHITQLVRNMTAGIPIPVPLPLPAPLHPGNDTGASNSTGHNTTATDSSTTASPHSRRSKPDWQDHTNDEPSGPVTLPLNIEGRSDSDTHTSEPHSVGAAGLPVDPPIAPPVSPPVAPPTVPSPPGASQGNNSSATPAPPVAAPPLPVGAPSPPVGASPFSPSLPMNPPNSPAQAQ